MGQELSAISCSNPRNDDILDRELKMYQWRANPNFNMHIARASFKSSSIQHQEELFVSFLQQYRSKQYIEIDKIKEELSRLSNHHQDQVVVFQQYRSTLKDMKGQLTFEQTLYILYGLLIGFEQLKKVYDKIVVDSDCCFITTEGAIRAWVNPDPKSNVMWQGQFRQHTPEGSHNHIMLKIIKMVQESGKPSKRGSAFYDHLTSILHQKQYYGCSFSQLRKWINEYCFMHNIQMTQGVASSERNTHRESTQSRKSQNKNVRIFTKENNLFKSTIESQKNENRPSILVKSKSIDKIMTGTGASFKFDSEASNSHRESARKESYQNKLHQSNSDIRRKQYQMTYNGKYSSIVQSNNYMMKQSYKDNVSEHFHSQGFKKSTLLCNKIEQIPSVLSSNNTKSIKQQEQPKINVHFPTRNSKKEPILKKRNDKAKPSMQASIINCIPQSNIQTYNSFVRGQGKHRTVFKDSQNQISDGDNFSRPWITTKTITRLISSQDELSAKNSMISIAESSDYYNCSQYSGVLTQMGRDITKIPSNGQSKILRVSRDFQI